MDLIGKISRAIHKFDLNLAGRHVLTEAATGNYVVTPVIAAAAGAQVTAFTRDSSYGTVEEVRRQTHALAEAMGLSDRIHIITHLDDVELNSVDVVTNCGFLRPLTREFIARLSPGCVIPLMYEPWEFRADEIDLVACRERGIQVWGTHEADPRLRTMEYIGYIALHFLLAHKLSPFSANVLILGCEPFVRPIASVLACNQYPHRAVTSYAERITAREYNAIVLAESQDRRLLIGPGATAHLPFDALHPEVCVIHIGGHVDFRDAPFRHVPTKPRPFGFMSYTADFIDSQAVVDLHAAGLKVGEGMLAANRRGLQGQGYRRFMEDNFPALGFDAGGAWTTSKAE